MEPVEGIATVEDVEAFLARLDDVGAEHGVTVQAFDARYVVDRDHLARAVALADRAIERGENVARDRAVEILLYAAGRRQIERALEMGISEGERPVVVLVDDPEIDGSPDATNGDTAATSHGRDASARERAAAAAVRELLEPAETLGAYDADRVADFFDVGDAEREATDATLADLVRERVALLTVEK